MAIIRENFVKRPWIENGEGLVIHSSTWQSGPKGEWWVSSWLASIRLEILVQHFILCDKALFSPFITLFKRKSQRKIAAEIVIGRSGTRKYSIWMIVEVLKQDISWNSKLKVPTVWVVEIAKILTFSWHKLNEVMRSSLMMLRSPFNSHDWQRQNISSQYQHGIK